MQHFCSLRNENFSVLVSFQVVFGVKNTLHFERSARAFPIDQVVENTPRIKRNTLFVDCEVD